KLKVNEPLIGRASKDRTVPRWLGQTGNHRIRVRGGRLIRQPLAGSRAVCSKKRLSVLRETSRCKTCSPSSTALRSGLRRCDRSSAESSRCRNWRSCGRAGTAPLRPYFPPPKAGRAFGTYVWRAGLDLQSPAIQWGSSGVPMKREGPLEMGSPECMQAGAANECEKRRECEQRRCKGDVGRSVTNASSAFIKGGYLVSKPEEILHHNSTNEWLPAAHRASVSSGDLPGQGGHMTLYVIRGDSVTAHGSAPAIVSQGELVVQSIDDIEASGLSKVELTAIWNALPGTAKLAKFKD